jgi:putative two-component system response regulator
VVDDEPANTTLLSAMLGSWGFTAVTATNDSARVHDLCEELDPDLLFLDLHMPGTSGWDVLAALRPRVEGALPLPVLVLTADVAPEARRRALELGARDFLTKPFDAEEVRLRTFHMLELRGLQRSQLRHSEVLEQRVAERTRHLERARMEVLQRLAVAAEYRDDATGQHTARVARTAALLAGALGVSDREVRRIELAAPLHDLGKIGVSDTILLKPGRLTDAERRQMQAHARIGAEILAGGDSALLATAEQIALTHHERWDGGGYSAGLAGEQIPIVGRIVAVADVFDALTHERPYKQAWPVEQAVEEILGLGGAHFDPGVVEAFAGLAHEDLIAPVPGAQNGLPGGPVPPPHAPSRLGSPF